MGEKKNGLQSVPFGVSWVITCITVYKAVIILKALRNWASCMVMHNLNAWETKTDEKRKGREGGRGDESLEEAGEGEGRRSRGSGGPTTDRPR